MVLNPLPEVCARLRTRAFGTDQITLTLELEVNADRDCREAPKPLRVEELGAQIEAASPNTRQPHALKANSA